VFIVLNSGGASEPRRRRLRHVENHPEFTATVVESFLAEHEVVIVPTISAAKEQIVGSRFDVALVDYDLDDGKATSSCGGFERRARS
jgi:hypothetical protein